ncbi:MAG TPA: beta-ketoacyl-[acyl-carrier-protein] synthase family protein [bacterium]
MKRPRVVVTGLGVVSSIGIGWKAFWDSLIQGKSGIGEVASFDTSQFQTHRGGEVKGFNPLNFIESSRLRRYNRASQFAIAATKMAIQDAHLGSSREDGRRMGISIGTTMAEAQAIESMDSTWVQESVGRIHPRLIPQYPGNIIGAHVATELKCIGPNLAITTACAAGNYALAYASDLLRLGKSDVMIAGGADAFSRIAFMGFNRLLAVAPDMCQPFDRNRKGMMVGEGAGILILERLEDAMARKAPIYAEILGYGMSCDATHMTIPDVEGVKKVMLNGLKDAGIDRRDVDYINAHGTGTPANDRTECAAIRSVFGNLTDHLPVSSIKSMIGHTMGAASALEAIACVLAIQSGTIPPTINFGEVDPGCDIDCVPNISRAQRSQVVLNNSFAFGGNNACLVLSGYSNNVGING